MSDIELSGDKALMAALDEFPKRFANKALRKIMRSAMKIYVFGLVKATIAIATGLTRRRIQVRTAKGKRGQRLQRGTFGIAVQVAKDVHYAKWFLFDRRLRDGRTRTGDRTLRNALYENKNRMRSYIFNHAKAALPGIAAETRAATKAKG